MKLIALYYERKNCTRIMVREDYTSKKSLQHDLRANGYSVRVVLTEEQVKEILSERFVSNLHRNGKFKSIREGLLQDIKDNFYIEDNGEVAF